MVTVYIIILTVLLLLSFKLFLHRSILSFPIIIRPGLIVTLD